MWTKELKGGQTVVLTNKQHAQLLRRFDLSNVKKVSSPGVGRYLIGVSCLCSEYPRCSGCPFDVGVGTVHIRCLTIIRRDVGIKHIVPDLGTHFLGWDKGKDKAARQQIQRIYDYLASFTKVTKRPE